MKIVDIILKARLPPEFLDKGFKHFRVADKDKVTIDVDTGKWATGKKIDMPLYTIAELKLMGDIPNAKYLQFVPEGTPYSVIDFDTDKTLSSDHRKEQVSFFLKKILHQFEGIIEYSASGLGLHAYVNDPQLKSLPSDPYTLPLDVTEIGAVKIEIFSSNAPIILTGDLVEEPLDFFDTTPIKIRQSIMLSPKSENVKVDNSVVFATPSQEEIQEALVKVASLDKQNRLEIGYDGSNDCSAVDYWMASTLLFVTHGNQDITYCVLLEWMQNFRPQSHCKAIQKEIINKAKRAVLKAFSKYRNTTSLVKEKSQNSTISMKEHIMHRGLLAEKARKNISKSKDLARNVIYEGTLNVIYAKSGSGKSKMAVILSMEIANSFPNKTIYYFGPDLSNNDVMEVVKVAKKKEFTNFTIDQDATGIQFMELMDTLKNTPDVNDLVFVVDTLKKITSVNNKDGMSKTFSTLKRLTSRGATGIVVAHTNKDGETISGTAEVEQDSDNVLTVEAEYLGENIMKATIMASELRCRSRILPFTIEVARDGFEYRIVKDHVDNKSTEIALKMAEKRGNIDEVVVKIVEEYFNAETSLTKSTLLKEILATDIYTGIRKKDQLYPFIDEVDTKGLIYLQQEGRSIFCLPATENPIHTILDAVKNLGEDGEVSKKK